MRDEVLDHDSQNVALHMGRVKGGGGRSHDW